MRKLLVAVLFGVSIALPISADPIAVSGNVFGSTPFIDHIFSVNFVGSGLAVGGSGETFSSNLNRRFVLPGETLSATGSAGGFALGLVTATFNGVTYTDVRVNFGLNFSPLVVTFPTDLTATSVSAPFTMTGSIDVFSVPTSYLFSVQVFGQGIGTIQFDQQASAPGQFRITGISYELVPTPEPTTFVLLGSALGGLMIRNRRKKGAKAKPSTKPSTKAHT